MVRLKLFYATQLGINRAEDYQKISLTSDRGEDNALCPVIDLTNLTNKAQIQEIEESFKKEHGLEDLPMVNQG
jgi:hypothetical protein